MDRVMTDGTYASFNLLGIQNDLATIRQQYFDTINAEIAKNGKVDILPHLTTFWANNQFQEQQTQLAIASELRQLNKILQEQYWHETRWRRRWERLGDWLRVALSWRPALPRPWFQATPSGT